jgi:hypothetical protein
LANSITVSSCKYSTLAYGGTNVTLNVKRTSDDVAVSNAGNLQVAITSTAGLVQTASAAGSAPGSNGAVATIYANATINVLGVNASEVTLKTEFTLKNGNKVTCSSTPVPCSA